MGVVVGVSVEPGVEVCVIVGCGVVEDVIDAVGRLVKVRVAANWVVPVGRLVCTFTGMTSALMIVCRDGILHEESNPKSISMKIVVLKIISLP